MKVVALSRAPSIIPPPLRSHIALTDCLPMPFFQLAEFAVMLHLDSLQGVFQWNRYFEHTCPFRGILIIYCSIVEMIPFIARYFFDDFLEVFPAHFF